MVLLLGDHNTEDGLGEKCRTYGKRINVNMKTDDDLSGYGNIPSN
jgi:hypothetical protein